jgi:hypothetical protein
MKEAIAVDERGACSEYHQARSRIPCYNALRSPVSMSSLRSNSSRDPTLREVLRSADRRREEPEKRYSLSSLSLLLLLSTSFSPFLLCFSSTFQSRFFSQLLLASALGFYSRLLPLSLALWFPLRYSSRHTSRPAVLQITMASTPKQTPGLSSHGSEEKPATNEPTVKKIREMDNEELLT